MKSEGLEIKPAGQPYSLAFPLHINIPQIQKEYIYQSGSNHARNLSAGEINRSIKETVSSLLADASSIPQTCLIRTQFMNVSSMTYPGDVNKSVE